MKTNVAFGIVSGILFFSLLVLFCALLIKLHIHKIKNYTRLIYQKDIDFQTVLKSTIIETQEQVLNNISQDLHDDAGQQLTAINFQLEKIKLDHPGLIENLDPVSQSVKNLSTSIRSISHSLNNQLLMQQDLLKAITTEVERLQKNSPMLIKLNIKGDPKRVFPTDEKIVIYRIFQESISNSFKHAKATFIEIRLTTTPTFELVISDNGKGFNSKDMLKNKAAIGVNNMRTRAGIIGHHFEMESVPGIGTTVMLLEIATI